MTVVDLFEERHQLATDERQRLEKIESTLGRLLPEASVAAWNEERFTPEFLPKLAKLGLGELFCDDSSPLFQGLVHTALARNDVSTSALIGIHNGLNARIVADFGSANQQQQWLPRLRTLDSLGAFCLTEPDHGSDIAGGLATTATPNAQGWTINGAKRWIGAGTLADIALVWARDTSDDTIKCFLIPTNTPGYQATTIKNKTGLRIMQNADITLDRLTVGHDALVPGAQSFSSVNDLLTESRAWVGWQAVGAQQAVLDTLLNYTTQRHQFGKPLANFQLIQDALAHISGNATACAALMSSIARLQQAGTLSMHHSATAKATTTRLARESASIGRDAMGGNGLVTDHRMAKIVNDIEVIHTYEGTYTINQLIVARHLTGTSAFVS